VAKIAGIGVIGLAVFLAALVVEITKTVHQQTSLKPGEAGLLHR
jgi:hypothetical protein